MSKKKLKRDLGLKDPTEKQGRNNSLDLYIRKIIQLLYKRTAKEATPSEIIKYGDITVGG